MEKKIFKEEFKSKLGKIVLAVLNSLTLGLVANVITIIEVIGMIKNDDVKYVDRLVASTMIGMLLNTITIGIYFWWTYLKWDKKCQVEVMELYFNENTVYDYQNCGNGLAIYRVMDYEDAAEKISELEKVEEIENEENIEDDSKALFEELLKKYTLED